MTMFTAPQSIPPFPPPSGEAQALKQIAVALERIADELHQLHLAAQLAPWVPSFKPAPPDVAGTQAYLDDLVRALKRHAS